MSIAYAISAHKSASQLERLFRALYHPDDFFVIHCDRRADQALHGFAARMKAQYPNVALLRPRAVLWSGYVMAGVQIEAMKVAEAHHPTYPWTHFVNLTGQDFPIKSRQDIITRLAADPEASYVTWFDPLKETYWHNARERLTRYYLEWAWLQRVIFLPGIGRRIRQAFGWYARPFLPFYRRKWPDFNYFGGANHVILSRKAANYLVTSPEAQRIIRWLKHSLHANEIVFQTALLNSPLAHTIVNEHFRAVEFEREENPHPKIWTTEDIPHLLASPCMFARKFDEKVDAHVLDVLERHVARSNRRTSIGVPLSRAKREEHMAH